MTLDGVILLYSARKPMYFRFDFGAPLAYSMEQL